MFCKRYFRKVTWNIITFVSRKVHYFALQWKFIIVIEGSGELKNTGKSRSLESNQTRINEWKLQTRFFWLRVCSWEIMKNAPSLMTPSTSLSGIQFSKLKVPVEDLYVLEALKPCGGQYKWSTVVVNQYNFYQAPYIYLSLIILLDKLFES